MSSYKEFIKICLTPLGALNKIIHKNPKKVVFYSNLGFRDNVLAMYNYFIEKGFNNEYRIIVATNGEKPDTLPKNVKYRSLLRGFFSYITAKYCFYSFGKYPVKPSKKQRVVNLWHGMPLKTVGRLCGGSENDDQNFFTHVIATSPFFADVMKKAFGAANEQVIITPQPRCDEMLKQTEMPQFLKDYDKIVVWMPTVISSKKIGVNDCDYGNINPFNEKLISELNSLLKEKNALLVIKPHPMDDAKALQNMSNVVYINEDFLKHNNLSIYSILKRADALLTDFSSIFVDFLILNKPIAFIIENLEEYKKSRGFVVSDAEKLMCGDQIKSEKELFEFFEKLFNGIDDFKAQRQECNELFNSYPMQSGCEKILKEIDLIKTEE